ncbi:MAG: hypothetical protein HN417_07050 [Desulfobacula sp.]|jgi:hypothetical protein|nr:hypothetical protein [Desulfobacula sp.]MBT6339634.1 hypothetical protein [Desulfobacula sp.]
MKKIGIIVLSCIMVFCVSAPSVMADTDPAPVAGTTDTAGAAGAAAGAAASSSQWGMLAGGAWITGPALIAAIAAGLIIAISDDNPAAHTHAHSH